MKTRRVAKQTDPRFPAGATGVWMVRTVVNTRESDAERFQKGGELTLRRLEFGRPVQPATDAGLVGDHDERPPIPRHRRQAVAGAIEQAHLGGVVEIARVLDDSAISVEEDGDELHRVRCLTESMICR